MKSIRKRAIIKSMKYDCINLLSELGHLEGIYITTGVQISVVREDILIQKLKTYSEIVNRCYLYDNKNDWINEVGMF